MDTNAPISSASWDDPFGSQPEKVIPDPPALIPSAVNPEPFDLDLDSLGPRSWASDSDDRPSIPKNVSPWPDGLTFDLSLGVDSPATILSRYDLTVEQYERFLQIPAFRRELSTHIRKNQEEGITFQRRVAAIAEDCIPDMYAIVKDPLVPAATRADTWKYMVKAGNLEPKTSAQTTSSTQVNIQINL